MIARRWPRRRPRPSSDRAARGSRPTPTTALTPSATGQPGSLVRGNAATRSSLTSDSAHSTAAAEPAPTGCRRAGSVSSRPARRRARRRTAHRAENHIVGGGRARRGTTTRAARPRRRRTGTSATVPPIDFSRFQGMRRRPNASGRACATCRHRARGCPTRPRRCRADAERAGSGAARRADRARRRVRTHASDRRDDRCAAPTRGMAKTLNTSGQRARSGPRCHHGRSRRKSAQTPKPMWTQLAGVFRVWTPVHQARVTATRCRQ